MSFFKKFGETVKDTASSIGAKSMDMMELGKLKLQKNQLENSIKEKKTEIGDLIYKAHKQGDIQDSEALRKVFSDIVELENQIAEIDVKLSKDEANTSTPSAKSEAEKNCSSCGAKISKDAKFCNNCGSAQ